jgi:hypothetical protein
MAASLNQQIVDAVTVRQLRLGRVDTGLRREVWAGLAMLETDLLGELKRGDPTDFAVLSRRQRQVDTLMEETLAPLMLSRYARIDAFTTAALVRLAVADVHAMQDLVNAITEDDTISTLPSTTVLRLAVTTTRFPTPLRATDLSATGAEWWQRQGESLVQRLRGQLFQSVALEEPLGSMVTRLRGTHDNGWQDGLMAWARSIAARLLTTAVTHATGQAREVLAAANADGLVLLHSSIRDTRTSPMCVARDGKRYEAVTHKPLGHTLPYLTGVPYHVNCRSMIVPVLTDGGSVAQESMTIWLLRQGEAQQDTLLGPTRAQLFRDGKLPLTGLLEASTGRPLTLEELGV